MGRKAERRDSALGRRYSLNLDYSVSGMEQDCITEDVMLGANPVSSALRRVRASTMIVGNPEFVLERESDLNERTRTTGWSFGADDPDSQADLELAFNRGPAWTPVRDATAAPWRSVCHLDIRFKRGPGPATGTGWLIDAQTVITAAHNIKHPRFGRARSIAVTPGRNANGKGARTRIKAVNAFTHPKWRKKTPLEERVDIGCIKLERSVLGSAAGAFGMRVISDRELRRNRLTVHVAGYPEHAGGKSMWRDSDQLSFSRKTMYYRADTSHGVSGAPVFAPMSDGQVLVVAVHTGGSARRDFNQGVRITDDIFDLIERWIDV